MYAANFMAPLLAARIENRAERVEEPRSGERPNQGAFELLYRQTAPGLSGYLRRLVRESALAEDLLQEAYLRYLAKPPNDDASEAQRRSYLYRIATNLTRDHWRRAWRQSDESPDETPVRTSVLERLDVGRALARLSTRERALVWLAHVEEWSHQEIGRILDLRPQSVRVLLFRARRKLARALDRESRTGETP